MRPSVVRSPLPSGKKGGCFIAGQNRNANKGAWRSLLMFARVVFSLWRLVEYTRTGAADMFSQGRSLSL